MIIQLLLHFLIFLPNVQTERHFVNYTQEEWVPTNTICRDVTYTTCKDIKCSDFDEIVKSCECQHNTLRCDDNCVTKNEQYCFDCLVFTNVTRYKCANGWMGNNCDIPICTTPCKSTEYCSEPDICTCYKDSTGACIKTYCTNGKDCYPGTCKFDTSCECPPGFEGDNCEKVSHRARIHSCYFNILYNGKNVGINCANSRFTPMIKWLSITKEDLNEKARVKIIANWKVAFDQPYFDNLPSYISNPSIAIDSSYFYIKQRPSIVNKCQDIKKICEGNIALSDYGIPISDGDIINFTIAANVLGYKYFNNKNTSFYQNNDVNDENAQIVIGFDNEPPKHCLYTKNCAYYPIKLKESIVNKENIEVSFPGWTDTKSGLDKMKIEVFLMSPSGIILEQHKDPISSYSLESIKMNDNLKISLKNFGVYSIIQTVYDQAQNFAKARKLVLYTDEAIKINESAPVYLDKSKTIYDSTIKTSFINVTNPSFVTYTLDWKQRYLDANKEVWKYAAEQYDQKEYQVDDVHNLQSGRRSVYKMNDYSNILSISYSYNITTSDKEIGVPNRQTFNFSLPTDPIQLNLQVTEDSILRLWFKIYDIFGNNYQTEEFKTIIQTKADQTFKIENLDFQFQTATQYDSSFYLDVKNSISGIKEIQYSIVVKNYNGTIFSDIFNPVILTKSSTKRSSDGKCNPDISKTDCFCGKFLPHCYLSRQEIIIDNCKFDKYGDSDLLIKYKVVSFSNSYKSGEYPLPTIIREKIPCRPQYLSKGAIVGISLGVILGVILLILLVIFCILYFFFPKNKYSKEMHNFYQAAIIKHRSSKVFSAKDTLNPIYTSNEEYQKAMNIKPNLSRLSSVITKSSDKHINNYIIDEQDVTIRDTLAEGRFATVMSGVYQKKNKNINVAIKLLSSKPEKRDDDLMRRKILFLKNAVRLNTNLVEFLGAMNSSLSATPCIVMEYCDTTLSAWLAALQTVDREPLIDLLRFSTHIANALKFLHKSKIIHRRVALRNVLLKMESHGYQAKLIGYGPSRDMDPEMPNRSSLYPLKWLAIETLESLDNDMPVFTTMTDIWSYGVTLWEIFSKGDAPYSQHSSLNIRSVLVGGERLGCPQYCPEELYRNCLYLCWDINPNNRPSFTKIIKEISDSSKKLVTNRVYYATNQLR